MVAFYRASALSRPEVGQRLLRDLGVSKLPTSKNFSPRRRRCSPNGPSVPAGGGCGQRIPRRSARLRGSSTH